nr:hypothetical protein [Anaerolineae bacterium]
LLDGISHDALQDGRAQVSAAAGHAHSTLVRIMALPQESQQAHARLLADAFILTAQAALMLHEAQWELDHGLMTAKPDIADYFINKHLRPAYDPLDDDQYLKRLARLMAVV